MHQVQVRRGEAGYAMAALLVAMALMAVMMSVAMPVWRQAAQREKEAELIWRGQQYDRALQLFRRKTSAPGPPNLDILIQQKYLRKKYKDPITGGEFELRPLGAMGPGSPMPGMPGPGGMRPGMGNRGSTFGTQTPGAGNQSGAGRQPAEAGDADADTSGPVGGPGRRRPRETSTGTARGPGQLIGGVRSTSKARSIRELNGRTRYDQWEFVYVPYNPNPQPPGLGNTRPGQAPGQPRPGTRSPGSSSPQSQRPGSSIR